MLTRPAILILLAASACALPFRERDQTVRVLVYNIHAGKDGAGASNLDAVAGLVRTLEADVTLLQEVDRGTKRSGGVDQLQVLMDRTEVDGSFGRSLDYDGGLYGIAALSRGGFGFEETVPLPVSPSQARAGGAHEPRVALATIVRTVLGRLQAINTHLDASGTDVYRLQEVQEIGELLRIRRSAGTPVMLGGDLNATPDSAVIAKVRGYGLRDAWAECGKGDGFTYPASKPIKRIDYLFLDGALRCTDATVIESQASDHRPLLVTVTTASGQ